MASSLAPCPVNSEERRPGGDHNKKVTPQINSMSPVNFREDVGGSPPNWKPVLVPRPTTKQLSFALRSPSVPEWRHHHHHRGRCGGGELCG
eukprot:scaffold1495_cov186-Alexandrium_tamarense.AAC.5